MRRQWVCRSLTSIGSMMPWGNPGADPTICSIMVSILGLLVSKSYVRAFNMMTTSTPELFLRARAQGVERQNETKGSTNVYQNSVLVNLLSYCFDISLKIFIYWNTPQLDVEILCCLVICWVCRFRYDPMLGKKITHINNLQTRN